VDSFKLSKRAKDQLVALKRRTGLENWNVLCRWAFCVSLLEPAAPRDDRIPADSNVEMTWRTFAGDNVDVYLSLVRERCVTDGFELTDENLLKVFRLHVHRGIGYLMGDKSIDSIAGLVSLVTPRR
jgi:DNA sulfur modification protein DndE